MNKLIKSIKDKDVRNYYKNNKKSKGIIARGRIILRNFINNVIHNNELKNRVKKLKVKPQTNNNELKKRINNLNNNNRK